ncbi:MAG: MFS transporter [Gorillibacterium sp.]|nr:MFS transporter [Gorillibacterium sp.]
MRLLSLPKPGPAYRFRVLIMLTVLSGFCQGLMLPLLTVMLEKDGVSSSMNGLNAAAMYVGTFATMFFIEIPFRRFGYKPLIICGMLLMAISVMLFPIWYNLGFWVLLRIVVGIGDSSLHFCTQLWIIASSPKQKRGRNISLYGMSYSIGFSIGPIGLNLLKLSHWLPFVSIFIFLSLGLLVLSRLPNEYGEREAHSLEKSVGKRYSKAIMLGWFALLPALLYGYMESTMNSNFPIYGIKLGITDTWLSFLLPAIGLGSLILQFPLGALSDRIGRRSVLTGAGMLGGIAFLAIPFAGKQEWIILILLAIAGGLVGSFFSLGLAYLADLLPRNLLACSNVLSSILFSVGSLIGPNAGGFGMQYLSLGSMFYILGGCFLVFSLIGLLFRVRPKESTDKLEIAT